MNPTQNVILAYEMNGKELDRLHGYPLRLVNPSEIGARATKWLTDIRVLSEESDGYFTARDYRIFPPYVMPQAEPPLPNGEVLPPELWTTAPPITTHQIQVGVTYPAAEG